MRVTFITRECVICHARPARLLVTLEGLNKFNAGAHVDECFPELGLEARERIVSGVCGHCMAEYNHEV